MQKTQVIELFGGASKAADAIGVSPAAVSKWPAVLPPRIADRVIAALVRQGESVPKEWLHDAARPAKRVRSLHRCIETLMHLAAKHPENRAAYMQRARGLTEKAAELMADSAKESQ